MPDLDTSRTPDIQTARRRWFVALRSWLAVMRDPEDTASGARMVIAIDGRRIERNYQRFAAHPQGARVLAGAPSLFELLTNRSRLAELPPGSLGRSYLEFVIREDISTEELDAIVAPVEEEIMQPDAARMRFSRHMRASHDLWHVLTGYHRDLFGELQLIVFSHRQTGSLAFGWISRLARIGTGRRIPGGRPLLELAKVRGDRAPWLLGVDWEPLLGEPIDRVREKLQIGTPPAYTRYVRKASGFGLVPEESVA